MILFSFDCLDCWGEDLGSVNVGKVGAPFKYPHSFIANLKDIGRLRVLLGLCLGGWWSLGVGYLTTPQYWRGPNKIHPSIDKTNVWFCDSFWSKGYGYRWLVESAFSSI